MRKKLSWVFIGIFICLISITFVYINPFQSSKEDVVLSNENEDNSIRRIADNLNTDWALDAINLKSYDNN